MPIGLIIGTVLVLAILSMLIYKIEQQRHLCQHQWGEPKQVSGRLIQTCTKCGEADIVLDDERCKHKWEEETYFTSTNRATGKTTSYSYTYRCTLCGQRRHVSTDTADVTHGWKKIFEDDDV